MAPTLDLAIVQLRPRKGDYAANVARIGDVARARRRARAAAAGRSVPGDGGDRLLRRRRSARPRRNRRRARPRPRRVRTAAPSRTARRSTSCIGFYEKWRDTLYNSAAVRPLGDGEPEILHVHRKNFLPTYGLFDEERFVERGHEMRAFDTPWGRAAILVCEDAWHSLSGTVAALDDAQLIFLSSAAPARGVWPRDDAIPGPASVARWERLVRDIAEEHGVFVTFANLVGSEGGKMFPGASMVDGPARRRARARAGVGRGHPHRDDRPRRPGARAMPTCRCSPTSRTALPHLRDAARRGRPGRR